MCVAGKAAGQGLGLAQTAASRKATAAAVSAVNGTDEDKEDEDRIMLVSACSLCVGVRKR